MIAYPIWQMKYCTKSVLVDMAKIMPNKTYLYFVADRNYPYLYSVDTQNVKGKCPIIYNGKIYCYSIPIHLLNTEGELTPELEKERQFEYEKFKKYKEKAKQKNSK